MIDEIKEEGRAGLVAEQRQKFRVENMDEWILVNKLLTTQDTWKERRPQKLVPSHVMSSLSEVTREATSQMWQYGHRVRWMRTHSGERICRLRELQQPGLGPPQLLLPLNRTVMMTDLYPTDEEQRANKPAGMRGSCGATVALYVGDESWAGLKPNFTDGNDADGQFNLLNLERDIRQGKVVVDKLKHLCRLLRASMTTTGGKEANKSELERKLLDYIERNRTLLESLFQPLVQLDLPSDSWHNLQSRLPKDDNLFDVLSSLEGVAWEACVPVYEQDEAGKRVIVRDRAGLVKFRKVHGRMGIPCTWTCHAETRCSASADKLAAASAA